MALGCQLIAGGRVAAVRRGWYGERLPMETSAPEWSPQELNERVARGERFFVLDVRNRDEFEGSPIEGRTPLATANVPYFEMLAEAGDDEDLTAAVARYVEANLAATLPRESPVLTVCAKGGTAALVAGALRHLGYDVTNLAGGTAAWSRFYDARVAVDGPVTITQIARIARGCLAYLVESRGRAALVDPGRHVESVLELARQRGVTIDVVVDTHAHADHVSGGPAIASALRVPYWLHPYDAIHPVDLMPARVAYQPLGDGQVLEVGGARLECLWIPGHTLGSVAILVDGRSLLSADSIFIASIARPDLGGRADAWTPLHYRSLRRLLQLPDSTVVLPGHFSRRDEADERGIFAATLGTLRHANEGLVQAAGGEVAFAAYIAATLPRFPDAYVDIKRINAGLIEKSAEDLDELETGKNECAMGTPT